MSNNYVKKYDVGQIKLDLPYANYIHELPLLSFGDVMHTINLNLVFNYRRKADNSNPFYIAPGYQLNLQKRIIFENGIPKQFEGGNGKCTSLLNNGNGVFTFDDDSQRIIRTTSSGYEIEYADFSKDTYNTCGIITASYEKYSNNAFLTYQYDGNGKLTSISYKGRVITLTYSSNKLLKITYDNNVTELSYQTNQVIVNHYSGVNYKLTVSDTQYITSGTSSEGQETVVYSQELDLSNDGKTITIKDKIGDITVNTATYIFPTNWIYAGDFNQVEMTDKNGVKTRVQYEGENALYSYEIQDDATFTANNTSGQFIGSVNLHNTIGVPNNNKAMGVQTINDGIKLGNGDGNNQWNFTVTNHKFGYYTLSGWIKTSSDITSASIMVGESTSSLTPFYVSLNENHKWTYFSFMFYVDTTAIVIAPQNSSLISMRDFRLIYQGADESHLNMSECMLVNDNQEISFRDANFYYTSNGANIYLADVTFADIMRYKVSKKRNDQRNEAYYNNCRAVISNVQDIKVWVGNTYVSVSNFDLGIKTYYNKKAYLTRFKINENTLGSMIVKTVSVNGTEISTENLSANFDVMSSTVDGVTTNYERNDNGLVTKEYVSGVYRYDTVYSDALISVKEIDLNNGAVESTTKYFINTTWGGVYKVDICDALGNVKFSTENTHDGDMSTLTHKAFSDRNNSLTYSKGNIASMSSDTLNYTFTYTNKGELSAINKNGAGIETHTYSENNGETTVISKYPSEANPLHTESATFDKYGRLKEIDGILSNVYDLWPKFNESGELWGCADNGSSLLAMTTDLLRNETLRYKYNAKNILVQKTVTAKNNFANKISEENFEYDDANRLTKDTCIYNHFENSSVTNEIEYATNVNSPLADNRVSKYTYKVNGTVKAQTSNEFGDSYHRVTKKTHTIDGQSFSKEIRYNGNKINKTVDSRGNITTTYDYDCVGRINKINDTEYTYDAYGQLIQEHNLTLDKTFQYVYNGIGNIESVTSNGNTINFGYTDDRLTSYDGKSITYNLNGEVASYDGWNYSWNKGKLSSITTTSNARALKPTLSSSKTYSFAYNALGQRITSTYSYLWASNGLTPLEQGEVTSYVKTYHYDHSGRLISETINQTVHGVGNNSETIVFLYDESSIIGMVRTASGVTNAYYFQRNLQGDIVAIYDTNGTKIVEYTYDAWGNCTINSTTTNYVVAHANPIRYRGYYYDEDTNLYYLNARYYSPEFRRFISPDDTSYLNPENVNGLNLYCYCNNDPVNYADPSGHESKWWAWLIGGVAFVGAVVLTVLTGGALAPVFIGMGASILTGGLIEGAISAFNGESFWDGFSNGAANGAMWGGIFALGGAALRTFNIFNNGVVIGENMTRVKTAAKQLGGVQTYAGMPGFKILKAIKGESYAITKALAHNKAWLTRMMNWGVKVYDIGIDIERTIVRSPFYAMENALVNSYFNMIPCYLI